MRQIKSRLKFEQPMTTVYAKDLSLKDVHHVLGFQRRYNSSFTPLLSLEPLTDFEQQELGQIREDFDNYLIDGEANGKEGGFCC